MGRYVAKRLALLLPIALTITLLVFLMRALVPGDPLDVMTMGQTMDDQTKQALREELGLDKPLPVQFVRYVAGVVRGDLGKSLRSRQTVASEITIRFPNTVKLALAGGAVAALLGIGLGVLAGVRKDSLWDLLATTLVSLGLSVPGFWMGLLLMRLFALQLRWLPVIGSDSLKHLILPALTLGISLAAVVARMTRSAVLEVLSQDYIRTARSKGLPERLVVFRHALRNAMIPVVTLMGLQVGYLLGGAFVVEVLFAYRGLGQLAVQAIQFRDFPVVQGVTLVMALSVVLVNLAVDLVYGLLDPQIRYD
jgi:peptide/nickel transport system permease protein/oligopeptide transport system permease protein